VPPKQVKKEEGKEKKAVKAVAAVLLLLLALAAFVEAQDTQQGTQTGTKAGKMPDADKALSGFRTIAKWVVLGVRSAIAMAFWVAFAIMVAHFAIGKISPTRFQRMGAFWDGLERAKDIIYGYAWLFLLIFSIYAAIGIIVHGGDMKVDTAMDVVKWIMVQPIEDLYNEISRPSSQGTGQTPGQ
jgi:hypothetical protein